MENTLYNKTETRTLEVFFMKKIVRSVLALTLTSAMIFSAVGCKKKSGKGGSGSGDSSAAYHREVKEDDPYFEVSEAKVELKVAADPNKKLVYQNIWDPFFVGENLFFTYSVEYEMPQELLDEMQKVYSADTIDEAKYMELSEKLSEYHQSGAMLLDKDGNVIKQMEGSDDQNIISACAASDGNIYVISTGTPDPGTCLGGLVMIRMDSRGENAETINLDPDLQDVWESRIIPLDDGSLLVPTWGTVYKISKDGKIINEKAIEDFSGRVLKSDGKYYVLQSVYNEQTYEEKTTLQELNISDLSLVGNPIEATYAAQSAIQGDDGLYILSQDGIKKYNLLDGSTEMVLDWNNTDVNQNYLSTNVCHIKSDDEIYMWKNKYTFNEQFETEEVENAIVTLKRCEKNPHAGKTIINIGTMEYIDDKMLDYILDYNKDPNNKSRINTRCYMDYLEVNDYEKKFVEMTDKVYLDMLSGDGPDILLNFSTYSQFFSEEVLLDLNTMIDGENGFKRDEYFDNVLRAFEYNGKLFNIPVSVMMTGYLVNADVVGDRENWTYDDFLQVTSQLPDKMSVFSDMSCKSVLSELLSVSGSAFINYEKKETYFEGEDFKKILEIAKKYGDPNINPDAQGWEMEYHDPEEMLANDLLLMSDAWLYGIDEYARLMSLRGGKVKLMGAPSVNGGGLTAYSRVDLAISATSSHQQEAWDFIRFLFTEEQQLKFSESSSGMPLNRLAFAEKIDQQYESYQQYKKEMQEGQASDAKSSYCYGGFDYDMTPEMKEDMVKLMEKVANVHCFDSRVEAIINEEVAAYFQNQRSAEDVCKNIQNRAKQLVQER